jgi:metal-responsive CopG/Arc/MetJ family transcriptional regulator
VKTAISIPDRTFQDAEATAARLGISRSELYARAVRAFVDTENDDHVTEALDAVYADQPTELDPALAAAQHAALPHDDW